MAATSPDAIAATLRLEMGIPEAASVVDLDASATRAFCTCWNCRSSRAPIHRHLTRRWLLGRGLAAAMLPAIYSIVAPSPVEAQSPPQGAPTLTNISPNQGSPGTTVPVTLTGTNFVIGGTTVTVNSGGVSASNVIVTSATLADRGHCDHCAAAVLGAHTVTVTTSHGTSGQQTFTVNATLPPPVPTLTSVSPNQGAQGITVAVTLTGTNFVVGATTVAVAGAGVTVNNVVVGSTTSLTANFVLDPAAATGVRSVTVTTATGHQRRANLHD